MASSSPQSRTPQTKDELQKELGEQIYFLNSSCNAFDKGQTSEAKRIAVALRILLHDKGQSKSLLSQLDIKYGRYYYDSSMRPQPGEESGLSQLALVAVLAGNHTHSFMPLLGLPGSERGLQFDDWWNQEVILDSENNRFTRRKIILSIADQDGGAHVDPELEETYYKLSRLNSTRYFTGVLPANPTVDDFLEATENEVAPKVSPAFYTARQIAHEVLVSLLIYSQSTPDTRTLYHYDENLYSGAAFAASGTIQYAS